jgi:hypothetical protein
MEPSYVPLDRADPEGLGGWLMADRWPYHVAVRP